MDEPGWLQKLVGKYPLSEVEKKSLVRKLYTFKYRKGKKTKKTPSSGYSSPLSSVRSWMDLYEAQHCFTNEWLERVRSGFICNPEPAFGLGTDIPSAPWYNTGIYHYTALHGIIWFKR